MATLITSNHRPTKYSDSYTMKRYTSTVAKVQPYESFRKIQKAVSVVVAVVFLSSPLWIVPFVQAVVKSGNNVEMILKAYLGG